LVSSIAPPGSPAGPAILAILEGRTREHCRLRPRGHLTTLEASSGGTLEIESVTNHGKIVELDSGTVELVNDTVTGAINLDSTGTASRLEIARNVAPTGGTLGNPQ
jgi:hypothetical protein